MTREKNCLQTEYMNRCRWIRNGYVAVLTVFTALALEPFKARAEDYRYFQENVLGTSLELIVDAPSETVAAKAYSATLKKIEYLEAILSTYRPESAINQFLKAPLASPQYVPKELIEVMIACDWWNLKTGGAFNPRIAELSALWKQCETTNRLPEAPELNRALARATQPAWKINSSYETVQRLNDVPVSLNAIAKGYILEKASAAAMESDASVQSVLLSIGGDIRARGLAQRTVGVANPLQPEDNAPPLLELSLQDSAVATSASYARGFDIQGKHYSHIIDPRNGYPVAGEVTSATVISKSAAEADALATALMILSPEKGLSLIEEIQGTECLLVLQDGQTRQSTGLDMFLKKETATVTAGEDWKPDFQLHVDFEINYPGGGRYHRPYIAAWIEDDQGENIKTLCLWLELGSSWVSKLSRWNQIQDKDMSTIRTITRATRMPGKYTLAWDGTNDAGDPVPTGRYNFYLEAVREKGTHQLIYEAIDIGDDSFRKVLKGNLEIKSAILSYGQTTR